MPPEIARHLCRAKLCHSRAVGEEEDRQISAHKLHPPRPELPFLGEPQPATIELDTSLEVIYLDIGMDREQGDASLADITNHPHN